MPSPMYISPGIAGPELDSITCWTAPFTIEFATSFAVAPTVKMVPPPLTDLKGSSKSESGHFYKSVLGKRDKRTMLWFDAFLTHFPHFHSDPFQMLLIITRNLLGSDSLFAQISTLFLRLMTAIFTTGWRRTVHT